MVMIELLRSFSSDFRLLECFSLEMR